MDKVKQRAKNIKIGTNKINSPDIYPPFFERDYAIFIRYVNYY